MNRRPLIFAAAAGAALIALAAWLDPPLPVDGGKWHNRFDHHFKKNARHYFGAAFDWRWFKAQGAAESRLRAAARSPQGALGVMQILPTTFDEIWQQHALSPGITDARWNIAAGIAYDRYLYDRWAGRVPDSERLPFALASYNAGFSRIARAREKTRAAGRDPQSWSEVAQHAPGETRHYVRKIADLMGRDG